MMRTAASARTRREELLDWVRFLQSESHVLRSRPRLFFQQSANQPDATAPAETARRRMETRVETRPWLRWVNKPQSRSACRAVLIGHTADVNDCAFSPDGTRIVSASRDRTVRVWDAALGQELATLTGHTDRVETCAFSPDGTKLLSASADKSVRLWDSATGAPLRTLVGHGDLVTTCAFSPDGNRIVSASRDGGLILWETGGTHAATLAGHTGPVWNCAFSPDGSRLVSASYDTTLKLWNGVTGANLTTLTGHKEPVHFCCFSPDGSLIVSAASGGELKLWDGVTGAELATMAGLVGCAFAPDGGRMVFAGTNGKLRLLDAGQERAMGSHGEGGNLECVFSPEGTWLVSRCPLPGTSGEALKLWDGATGADLATLAGHAGGVNAFAFSPDGTQLVSASADSTLRLWDLTTQPEPSPAAVAETAVEKCVISPDGGRMVSISSGGAALDLWDGETGASLARLTGHTGYVNACAFSPDGTRLVSAASDGTLRLWDATNGAELVTLVGHCDVVGAREQPGWVTDCAFSPAGDRIVAAYLDGELELWNPLARQVLARMSGHSRGNTYCAFSPDGTRVVSAHCWDLFAPGVLRLWDGGTGAPVATLAGHSALIECFRFAPNGSILASASVDRTVKLWDVRTGAELLSLSGHQERVKACVFSPDGTRILSASDDKTLRLWEVRTGRQLASLVAPHVQECAFSPDGRLILAWGSEALKVLSAATGFVLCVYPGRVRGSAWHPDGIRLAAGRLAGSVHLLELQNITRAERDTAFGDGWRTEAAGWNPPPVARQTSVRNEPTLENLRAVAERSYAKHNWDAAAASYETLLARGESLEQVGPRLVECLLQASSQLNDSARARIAAVIGRLESRGHADLATTLRQRLRQGEPLPSAPKPWWRFWI